jgi:hypothetical protein
VKIDRRARVLGDAGGQVALPGEFAILDLEIACQQHEEPEGHGVDNGWTFLHGEEVVPQSLAEGLLRQGLEPVRKAENGGDGSWQNRLELRRTAEGDTALAGVIHRCLLLVGKSIFTPMLSCLHAFLGWNTAVHT